MDAQDILDAVNGIRALRKYLTSRGVNHAEVEAAVKAKEDAGLEFTAADAQVFIDQAREDVDSL